jgi:nucleotide-binding universal stress UspA family protein
VFLVSVQPSRYRRSPRLPSSHLVTPPAFVQSTWDETASTLTVLYSQRTADPNTAETADIDLEFLQSNQPPNMARKPQPMSMEAMLDEERREVLALLEGKTANRSRPPSALGARSPSPYTPRSPVRSMLDVGMNMPSAKSRTRRADTKAPTQAPVRSMLDIDTPPPPAANQQPIRSMLDVDSPPTATKQVFSTPSSPTMPGATLAAPAHPRSMSDASSRPPADFGPRLGPPRADVTSEYQFSGIITAHGGAALPKRVTQGGRRASAMPDLSKSPDVSLVLPGDRGRHSIIGPSARAGNKSKSPHNRLGVRSHSPRAPPLLRNLSPAGRAVINDPEIIDYNNAYRRLSNAALARSGGILSELGRKPSANYLSETGRLAKDYMGPDGELLLEDSSDEQGSSSGEEGERGRKAARSFENLKSTTPGSGSTETKKPVKSLLAAAEEERTLDTSYNRRYVVTGLLTSWNAGAMVASQQPQYTYRSLLDEPTITVTSPSGDRVKSGKQVIHPNTSFDDPPGTGTHTPIDSDTEQDLTDIKRAQNLSFSMTQIMDMPEAQRTIQIITRGEWLTLVKEAEEEHRPPRKYLVATDLSEESAHALEWAIGTVLRDGDTLLAIYCVDEETGIGGAVGGDSSAGNTGSGGSSTTQVQDESNKNSSAKEQGAEKGPNNNGTHPPPLPRPWPLLHHDSSAGNSASPAPSVLGRERQKYEEERHRAVKSITERVTRLLRKTRLQVRVVVEVLHCKNPKHLITEVIDLVNPTLVILGSRGRSALKGYVGFLVSSFYVYVHSLVPRCMLITCYFSPQRHPRLILELPRHQIVRARHGCAQAPA